LVVVFFWGEVGHKSFLLLAYLLHGQPSFSPHNTSTVSCSKSWLADTWEKMGKQVRKQMAWKLKKVASVDFWQQGGRDLAAFPISSCWFYSHYVEVKVFLLTQAGIRQGALLATSCSYFMHQ